MNRSSFILALLASLVLTTTRVAGQVQRNSGLLHPRGETGPAGLVLFTAKLPIRPESREVFLTAATTMGGLVRQEAGCLDFSLYEDPAARGTFFLVEEWASEAALAAHRRLAYEQAYQQQLMALLAATATTTVYRVNARTVLPLLPSTR